MARTAMQITISGDKELLAEIRSYGQKGEAAARRGVRATAVDILADAKQRLKNGGHMVTSKLFNSGKVQVDPDDDKFIDVIFSGGGDGYTDYAEYVEFGRRAGKGLNEQGIEAVAQWAKQKGILHTYNIKTRKRSTTGTQDIDQRARDFAINLSKKYKRRGRKATPFLFPAFEAKRNSLKTNIEKELQALNDSYPNQ